MYLISEIFVCLVVAALLGAVVGWILKRWMVGDIEALWRSRLGQADDKMSLMERDSKTRIQALEGDLEIGGRRIMDLEREGELLGTQMNEVKGERDDLTTVAGRLNDEIKAIGEKLSRSETDRSDLKDELDSINTAHAGAQRKIDEMKSSFLVLTAARDELQTEVKTAEGTISSVEGARDQATARIGKLEGEIEDLKTQIAESEQSRVTATTTCANLESELASSLKRTSEIEGLLASAQAAENNLADRLAAANESFASERSLINDKWRVKWDDQTSQLATLSAAAVKTDEEMASIQQDHDELEKRLAACRKGNDDLASQVAAITTENKGLRAEAETARKEAAEAGRRANRTASDLDRERTRSKDLLDSEKTSVNRLTARVAELENRPIAKPGPTSQPTTGSNKTAKATRPKSATGLYSSFRSGRDKQHYFRFMNNDRRVLVRSEGYTTSSSCENGIRSVLKNAADPNRIRRQTASDGRHYFHVMASNGQIVGMSMLFKKQNDMEKAIDLFDPKTQWQRVGTAPTKKPRTRKIEPTATRDDLKKIHGIGPKIESILNRHGVHNYRQIAGWDRKDIERFAVLLGEFRGRIERDNWIRGAKKQHIEKYGKRNS